MAGRLSVLFYESDGIKISSELSSTKFTSIYFYLLCFYVNISN
jgi:hypothetical protein